MEQTVQELTHDMNIEEAVNALGSQLNTNMSGIPAKFSFQWAGYRFRGTLTHLDRTSGKVEITAHMGFLPFTAENEHLRRKGIESLNQCNNFNGVCFRVTSFGEVQCSASTVFETNISAVSVAQVLTVTLLYLRKYLKHLEGLLTRLPEPPKHQGHDLSVPA